jgi:hypothetical protein
MNSINIEVSRCPQNHVCPVISICHDGAISQKKPFSAREINEEKCSECRGVRIIAVTGRFKENSDFQVDFFLH